MMKRFSPTVQSVVVYSMDEVNTVSMQSNLQYQILTIRVESCQHQNLTIC